jgi:site-specific DNA-methyltransferase (adenine-specific)
MEYLCRILNANYKEIALGIPDKSVDLIIDDPPYNVPPLVVGPIEDYLLEMSRCLAESERVCKGTAYVFAYPEVASLLLPLACRSVPGVGKISTTGAFENGRLLAWHYKNKNAMHHRVIWSRSYESILMLWNGKDSNLVFNADEVRQPYLYPFKQGSFRKGGTGRYGPKDTRRNYHERGAWPRDIIEYAALSGGKGKSEGVGHPTQKPAGLIDKLIMASSKPGDTVLDWHAGSFTTAFCAQRLGRKWISCEINPEYCKIGTERLSKVQDGG